MAGLADFAGCLGDGSSDGEENAEFQTGEWLETGWFTGDIHLLRNQPG